MKISIKENGAQKMDQFAGSMKKIPMHYIVVRYQAFI